MTRRPTLLTAIALTASAVLSLSGCGGGDSSEGADNDKIAGADQGEVAKSPSPESSASTAVERPKIELPSDVKDVYEDWKTGDQAKDAILADAAGRIDATNDAILRGDTDALGLTFYYKDKALTEAVEWVQAYVDANLSFTGTTRYYAPQVTFSGEKSATLVYCADESKGFNKDRGTNKVDRTPSGESPYVLYNTRLEKSKQGVWLTTNLVSTRGDKTCTR